MTKVQLAKERVRELLRNDPSVRGVGITWSNSAQCVLVNVATGTDQFVRDHIKSQLPDVDFVIQEVSEIRTDN